MCVCWGGGNLRGCKQQLCLSLDAVGTIIAVAAQRMMTLGDSALQLFNCWTPHKKREETMQV